MKRVGLYYTGALLLTLVLVSVAGAQPITPPAVISSPGTYELVADARGINDVYGIKVESSDVVIDGQNYFLGGGNREKSAGVYVNKYGSSITNVTVKNLKLENWDTAVDYNYVKGNEGDMNLISNCDIVNSNTGLKVEYSDYVTLDSNMIREISTGISIDSLSTHVTVDDNTLKDCGLGISVLNADEVIITENNINTCQVYGIEAIDSTHLNITKNSVSDNKYAALRIENVADSSVNSNNFSKTEIGAVFVVGNGVSDIVVTDNYFGSVTNVIVDDISSGIIWNTTLQTGMNILGGPYLGGNYWGSAPGLDGFSDKAPDEDGYGIADEPYQINDYNTDYLPLHPSVEKAAAPFHVPIIPPLPVTSENLENPVNISDNDTPLIDPGSEVISEESIHETRENITGSVQVQTPLSDGNGKEQNTSSGTDNVTGVVNSTPVLSILNQSVANAYAVDEVEQPFSVT